MNGRVDGDRVGKTGVAGDGKGEVGQGEDRAAHDDAQRIAVRRRDGHSASGITGGDGRDLAARHLGGVAVASKAGAGRREQGRILVG